MKVTNINYFLQSIEFGIFVTILTVTFYLWI